ncbi:hypothetical protein PVAP13_9NG453114 [Panicum virgatum]|uniref:Uncharacterized protein n=1 Tax=Panicum virgatum TaxID=38727 RepID=A0A8T0MQ82_PANVG|nr:hypothetical protein PVAP13_9NG453114 [Panicum virgatum]
MLQLPRAAGCLAQPHAQRAAGRRTRRPPHTSAAAVRHTRCPPLAAVSAAAVRRSPSRSGDACRRRHASRALPPVRRRVRRSRAVAAHRRVAFGGRAPSRPPPRRGPCSPPAAARGLPLAHRARRRLRRAAL